MKAKAMSLAVLVAAGCFCLAGATAPKPSDGRARTEVRVKPTATDATGEMLAAIEAVRRAGGGKIVLEKGDYHFRAETATQMKFFISNHHQSDSHPVHVPLANLTDVTVEGNGAKFICHGLTMAMAILDSTNVTVKGVSVDWARPFLTAARVVGLTDTTTDIAVDMTREPCAVKDDRLVICGEGWQLPYETFFPCQDETKAIVPGMTDIWWRGKATAREAKGTFRLAYDAKSLGTRLGDWLVVRPDGRPAPATIVYRSRGTVYEDVVLHSAFGMGVICQRSDGFTWRGTRPAATRTSGVFAPAGTDRFATLHADATHFSNVKGEVRIEDCLFEGMMDDAINVHSTCLGITEKLDARRIRCRYKHRQAYGFGVFEKGESLRLIRGKTLENGPTLPIASVEDVDPWEVVLTLGADLPAGYGVGDAVENADYQPSVVFSRNIVGRNRARGALFTTPKSVRVTDNLFDHVSGSAILFAGDAQGWYESGACEDVVVSGNRFYDCLTAAYSFCKGVLSFYPEVRDLASRKKAYHRNIVVTNNVFDVHDVPLVFAISTENLDFRGNRVYQNRRYAGWGQGRFVFSHCSNMRVEKGNLYLTVSRPQDQWAIHDRARPNPPKVEVSTAGVPSDALVLFDGTEESFRRNWRGGAWRVADGALQTSEKGGWIDTKERFADCQLHLEWRVPAPASGRGQDRGNSGICLGGCHEIQILECYDNNPALTPNPNPTYADGQAGAVYGHHPPQVNPSKPAGEWQTYDIIFHPAAWDGTRLVSNPSVTVLFNGVVVQDNAEIWGNTFATKAYEDEKKGPDLCPISLQDHNCPVMFRNIWVRRLPPLPRK